ncbi:MAG: hypothetical protein R6V08_00810 [Desulfuromonadales bacterium]
MSKVFRKIILSMWMILWFGLLPALAGATALEDFRRDISLYREGVEDIQQREGKSFSYLESMKKEAEYLSAFARHKPPAPESLDKRISEFKRFRLSTKNREPSGDWMSDSFARRQEDNLWSLLVEPYTEESYLGRLVRERTLLQRREYDFDFDESGNFIEKPINNNLRLLQYRNEQRWYRQHGVSRFEFGAGAEPFILLDDDNSLGIMASLALQYHLFPQVRQNEKNRYLAELQYDGWWDRRLTRHLRKFGFRVGAGALFDGPTAALGVGLSLRSVTVWGLYSTGDTEYSLAIGFSDLEWLEKIGFVGPF